MEAFRKLGFKDFDSLYSKAKQSDLFDRFEEGKFSAREFRKGMKKFLKPTVSHKQIDDAWNAMLLDFPAERIKLLTLLKSKYKIYLLSNTNEIHMKQVMKIFKRSFGAPSMSALFEKAYFTSS